MPELIIPKKKCPTCGEVKLRTDFYKSGYCKVCSARKQRERWEAKAIPMKTLKGEEWRDVIGYEGVYKVSNLGRVQRLKGYKCAGNRILRIKLNKGYPTLMLSKNGKTKRVSVHKLVTDAFIGPCPDGLEVNHIDHDRANARADNLEYCTRQRNIAYAVEQGRFRAGDRASLNSVIVKEIKELLRQGISVASIARNYGTSLGAISAIKSRRNWKYIE